MKIEEETLFPSWFVADELVDSRHEREEGSISNAQYRCAMVKLENCISIFNQIHFALESAFLSLEKRQGFQSFWIFKVSNARLQKWKWIIFSWASFFSRAVFQLSSLTSSGIEFR